MQRTLIIIGAVAGLAGSPAYADTHQSSKEETIGVGIGATIGAVAGGPVGAIVGAAVGAKFGNKYYQKNEQVAELSGSLQTSAERIDEMQRRIADLNSDVSSLGGDLERMRAVSRPELLSLMKAGIEMDLLFRTDEHVLGEATGRRLRDLAASLASMPDIKLRVDGFADERGDAAYNDSLSAERAEYVRELLIESGVADSRIAVSAHGESPAAEAGADSYALERKVRLTLFVEDLPSFASNPD